MSKLRLLLVTDAVGGVWTYSLELARALRPLGIETVLAVMGPSPAEKQREEAAEFKLIDTGLPLEWLDTSSAEIRRAGRALAALAECEGVDLVQTCSAALLADVAPVGRAHPVHLPPGAARGRRPAVRAAGAAGAHGDGRGGGG